MPLVTVTITAPTKIRSSQDIDAVALYETSRGGFPNDVPHFEWQKLYAPTNNNKTGSSYRRINLLIGRKNRQVSEFMVLSLFLTYL